MANSTIVSSVLSSVFKAAFTFRSIKASEAKFAETLAAFEAAKVAFEYETVEVPVLDEDGVQVVGEDGKPTTALAYASICRKQFEAELPVVTMQELADLDADFVKRICEGLVETAARKLFVDKLLPIGQLDLQSIIVANTPAVKESQIDPKLLADFLLVINANFDARPNVTPVHRAAYMDMINGRFASKVWSKHPQLAKAAPATIGAFTKYCLAVEGGEKFLPILEVFSTNYGNYVKAQEAKKVELNVNELE